MNDQFFKDMHMRPFSDPEYMGQKSVCQKSVLWPEKNERSDVAISFLMVDRDTRLLIDDKKSFIRDT